MEFFSYPSHIFGLQCLARLDSSLSLGPRCWAKHTSELHLDGAPMNVNVCPLPPWCREFHAPRVTTMA
ncbi:unnamed protein product, partial [Nesidiocoris tenuis]